MTHISGAHRLREQIRLLERKLGVLNENDMTCCDVTLSQCHALVEIGRAGSLTLSGLAEILGLDNSTTSRTVNNLVTRNLARRVQDPEDRRYVTITLTDPGIAIFETIESRMNARFTTIYEALPPESQETVLESVGLLLNVLGKDNCC